VDDVEQTRAASLVLPLGLVGAAATAASIAVLRVFSDRGTRLEPHVGVGLGAAEGSVVGVVLGRWRISRDAFAASFDPAGQFRWQYAAGSTGSDRAFGVAVAPNDDVVLVGAFSDMLTFGDEARTSAGAYDIYVVALTSDGAYRWDHVGGGASDDGADAVAVDDAGRVAVGGAIYGDADLGFGPLDAITGPDGFFMVME
jgi:hypothetical protein